MAVFMPICLPLRTNIMPIQRNKSDEERAGNGFLIFKVLSDEHPTT